MRRRSWALGGLAWLAVVVVVATATWAVIDSAGRLVLTAPAGDRAPGGVDATALSTASTAPAPRTTPARASSNASSGASPSAPDRSTAAARGDGTATAGVATPTPSPAAPTPSSRRGSGVSPAPDAKTSPVRPSAEVRTWQGAAGSVTVRCVGPRISLVSTTPTDGWRMEVDKRGPEEVRVHFERGETDDESESEGDEREAQVQARCGGGVPRFSVES